MKISRIFVLQEVQSYIPCDDPVMIAAPPCAILMQFNALHVVAAHSLGMPEWAALQLL